ncbi:hypothetical protein FT663_03452 [Candidozyma haemuli var. vulneris]|uniref:Altered inheritance of mitochondria protein 18, mitochondrial n=1 Tax=Candidozyma haemuli TaxID=45357 RepID=A0A2V1AXF9_9ASCO|nr:hypothetical protein CXQ85_000522 [[Candida] haemuloni]KAF3988246.1 hypothetical protein FT662_03517 [[Candida] haemuloni var. vulneris]KAF3989791.1 hypothetical protein FT663_03452 [[Candida] haemuloni var. vulneris]PVH21541.1 hypothetical protein CXQ85_000522 [[Candida] haemuloni]
MFRFLRFARPFARMPARSLAVGSTLSISLAFGSVIANDASKKGLEGVDLDKSIDPFPTELTRANCSVVDKVQRLVASGMRSVTFISFKVYAVGLYVPTKDEPQISTTVAQYMRSNPGKTAEELLGDKQLSQEILENMSQRINYTIRITPVRNTDFGHLRDGFVKTILACPLAKTKREEVATGIEQLRAAFQGFKGSVPKNHSLYLVTENNQITMHYVGNKGEVRTLGKITEPSIAQVLFVSYFSSAKPISEQLRKDFVSYVTSTLP